VHLGCTIPRTIASGGIRVRSLNSGRLFVDYCISDFNVSCRFLGAYIRLALYCFSKLAGCRYISVDGTSKQPLCQRVGKRGTFGKPETATELFWKSSFRKLAISVAQRSPPRAAARVAALPWFPRGSQILKSAFAAHPVLIR
jgi:hypothetical protein